MTLDLIVAYAEAKKKRLRQTTPPTPTITTPSAATDTDRWAQRALHAETDAVTQAPEGTRNHTLNRAAFNLGQLIAGGHLQEPTVVDALTTAAHAAGLDPREIHQTIRSGLTGGQQHPRTGPATPLQPYPDLATFDDQDAADTFWGARPELDHIRTFARARRACPWAVLGVILARITVAVPPFVVLPALVGSDASLNLFVALVATSGGGKGASEACATDAINLGNIDTAGVGSGEGIAHLFKRRTRTGVEDIRTQVLMRVAEIDTLAALGDRKGATLLPELRKAWSGEDLGFAYADPTKALPLPAHSYRLALVAGVQPGRAQWVLDDAAGGTPQRFLWLPASDPHAPDTPPPCPKPLPWTAPSWPVADYLTGRVALPVCQQARTLIDANRLARLRGEGETLDGHALLTRLKTAAALALLNQRINVNDEDWALSEVIADLSEHTRAGIVDHLQREAQNRNQGRAEAEATRAVLITERVEDAAIQRVCRGIHRTLKDGPKLRSDLSRKITSRDRQYLDEALDRLVQAGQITADDTDAGGTRWTLA